MKWIIEQLIYLLIAAAPIALLGFFNTLFQMYLYEH